MSDITLNVTISPVVLNLQATPGAQGTAGWSPVLANVADGNRRVLQVIDWQGGAGAKPATGLYIGTAGLTATLALGVDVRGPVSQDASPTIEGKPSSNEIIPLVTVGVPMTFSIPNSFAKALTAATASYVITLKNLAGATVATITFGAGQSVGVFAWSITSFANGDCIYASCQGVADATLSDIFIALVGG